MLDRCANILALQAGDVGHRHARREVWIFRITFEVAAVERRAVDVDRRPQQKLRALGFGLLAQRLADLLDQLGVPAGGQRDADREAGRADIAAGKAAAAALTWPASTAASSLGPRHCGGPGISRSSPFSAASMVLLVPNQSDMTMPL